MAILEQKTPQRLKLRSGDSDRVLESEWIFFLPGGQKFIASLLHDIQLLSVSVFSPFLSLAYFLVAFLSHHFL